MPALPRRPLLQALPGLALGLAARPMSATVPVLPLDLSLGLTAPAEARLGAPLPLRFTLRNRGSAAVRLLRWGTPFEGGWLAPFVDVRLDGQVLRWQGPQLKRGDPAPADYLGLAPGEQAEATLDLAEPVALERAGLLQVKARVHLHDLIIGADARPLPATARPRAAFRSLDLPCTSVDIRLLR